MKEASFNTKTALRAFNTIITKGKKTNGFYRYQGLQAISDYDGYTLVIKNEQVSLTLFFHHKYAIDFSNRLALDAFYQKIEQLGKGA